MSDRPRAALVWAIETFGAVANNPRERTLRFVEEAVELGHAMGLDRETVEAIVKRVWSRDKGYIPREIGQSLMTLEAQAECVGHCADREAENEFKRVRAIPQEEWTRRHSAKQQIGIAERH